MICPVYKRILLKLSGEALMGSRGFGFDPAVVAQIADEIKEIHDAGVEIGIVIGGGNIFRGASSENIGRCAGDSIGMLATTINSLVIKDYLVQRGVDARVLSATEMPKAAEYFTSETACR